MVDSPSQSKPPPDGNGHAQTRVAVPLPHVTEHDDAAHQPPSTMTIKVQGPPAEPE
jgi:hypothetical protein